MSMFQPNSLIAEAIAALDRSHPSNPPHLRFGAAVSTSRGTIYSASAFWSDTLTLALHAEHAAVAHAAAHGERDIRAIACVSTEDPVGEGICHPCGLCKQILYESSRGSGIDLEVYMASRNGTFVLKRISELAPFPWPSK